MPTAPGTPDFQFGDPLARGAVWAWTGSNREAISGVPGVLAANGRWRSAYTGRGLQNTGTSGTGATWSYTSQTKKVGTAFTMMFWGSINTNASDNKAFLIPANGTWTGTFVAMGMSIVGNAALVCRWTSAGAAQVPTGLSFTADKYNNIMTQYLVTRNGANCAYYINGVQLGTSSGSDATAVQFNTNQGVTLGGNPYVTTEYVTGYFPQALIWNRALTAAEVARLYSDPWRLWTPKANPADLFGIAASVPKNISATAVAAVFVIPTPAITVTTRPSPTAVAQTWTITTPAITVTTRPTPTVVAQAWTIPTPVISTAVSATLTKVTGVFVIPTPVPSVTTNISPTVAAASFTIPAPSVTVTTTPTPTVAAATFVIPTPTFTLTTTPTPTAVAGSFTIPTPSVTTGSTTSVAATAVAGTFVIPTPSITASATVAVTRVAMVATIPAPSVANLTNVSPVAVAMLMAAPTPVISSAVQILATVVAAVFAMPTPVPSFVGAGGSSTGTVTAQTGAGAVTAQTGAGAATAQTGAGAVTTQTGAGAVTAHTGQGTASSS